MKTSQRWKGKGVVLYFLVREFRLFTSTLQQDNEMGCQCQMSKQFFDNEETTTCKGDTRRKNKRDKTYGSRCRPGVLDPWRFQSVPVRLEPVANSSLSLFTKLDLQVLIVAEWEHRSCKPILFQVWFQFNWSSRKQLFVSMILEKILLLPCTRWFLLEPGEQHQHQKAFEKTVSLGCWLLLHYAGVGCKDHFNASVGNCVRPSPNRLDISLGAEKLSSFSVLGEALRQKMMFAF